VGGVARRTQTLTGGLLATAPFHWGGEASSLHELLEITLVGRMGGQPLPMATEMAMGSWLDGLPSIRPSPATQEVGANASHGAQLFESTCKACHGGAHLTTNATVDVGTGGRFQVPSLSGVWARGPWLHDGCAKTLEQRFDPGCGGATHPGSTLAPADVADLVAYLKTL
jgi:cytochrome c peroxidase